MAVCGAAHVEVELSLVHGNAEGEAPPEYGVCNWHAMLIFIFNPLQCIDILLMPILLGIDPSSLIRLWFIKHSTFSCKHKSLAFRCIDGKEELYTTLRKREHHARQQYPLELISGTGHKCRSLRRWPMPEHRIVSGRLAEKKSTTKSCETADALLLWLFEDSTLHSYNCPFTDFASVQYSALLGEHCHWLI
jgi:hypothetical protein